ncbi:RES family NAD+ phosphorylase [Zooshikella harenae]|uniref:RES domain-containing protein n=1 Tax=Zooshikella harenae TaxID=2827238 RepID=A0ABS5ZJV4_9GAMM|nr:RES domain-containing protein [Zooshikella harenae]MBU2714220.1 RES domain-containing protein [Zooshikella harenae]
MKLPIISFKGKVYRAHNPRWSFLPTSGEGAARHGGRFNPIGIPTLYTSERFETAWLEAQQGFPYKTQPLTLCTYQADCKRVLDLTQPGTLSAIGTSFNELASPWELIVVNGETPPTWELAKKLIQHDVAGIRVQSFANNATAQDINWVFWSWEKEPNTVVVIDDESRLPKNQKSWDEK